MSDYRIEILVRTKTIEEYYSHQQIEQTLERVKLEMQSNTRKINASLNKMSTN